MKFICRGAARMETALDRGGPAVGANSKGEAVVFRPTEDRQVRAHQVFLRAAGGPRRRGIQALKSRTETWLGLAWSGQIGALLKGLRAVGARVGQPPPKAKEDDPGKVVREAVGYVGSIGGWGCRSAAPGWRASSSS